MSEPRIKFIHARIPETWPGKGQKWKDKGGFTIAYSPVEMGDKTAYHVAWAICSKKDNFNKKIGRLISSGRLLKGIAEDDPDNWPECYDFIFDSNTLGEDKIQGIVDLVEDIIK